MNDAMGMLSIAAAAGRIRVLVDRFLMPVDRPMPVVSSKQVHGIEVHAGPAAMPRELIAHGDDAFCGLVVIWTK